MNAGLIMMIAGGLLIIASIILAVIFTVKFDKNKKKIIEEIYGEI